MKRKLILGIALILTTCVTNVIANEFFSENINGFIEARSSIKFNEIFQQNNRMAELRLQVNTEQEIADVTLNWVTDFVVDSAVPRRDIDFESGAGVIDQRQLNMTFPLTDNIDVKLGRQILTWGTGDTTFINDLFPKDYQSFYLGRNDEYLKAPSDALKISVFSDFINANFVYTPRFDADRYISGERLSFFDASQLNYRDKNNPIEVNKPDKWFSDDELAIRLYQNVDIVEAALYFYEGYRKSPAGVDQSSGRFIFPKLKVYGASARSPLFSGIANIEAGYYQSHKASKLNPFLPNSDLRLLIGFEKAVAKELTAGFQYDLTRMLDYSAYRNSLPEDAIREEEYRQVVTVRLTKMLLQQKLRLSLFNFFEWSNKDGYLRFNVLYKLADDLGIEGGGNYFYGKKDHTSFNQFKKNNNFYTAMRFSY